MAELASEAVVEARLRDFLSAELRRAESDFPNLPLRVSATRSRADLLGFATIVVVLVAAVALMRPWGGLPATPGGDPLGPDWGPLAVTPTNAGMDARNEGSLILTDRCVFLERGGERELLVWPANQTTWSPAAAEILFQRSNGGVMTMRDGQRIVLGGGGSSRAEGGLAGADWAARIEWAAKPDPECLVDVRFLVSDVLSE